MKQFPDSQNNSPSSTSRARLAACGFALAAVATIILVGLTSRGDARGKEEVEVAIRPDLAAAAAASALADDDKPEPGTGTLRGVVTFKGAAPKRRVIVAKGDPKIEKEEDRKICAAEDLLSDELIVNEKADNGVANVCIFLKSAPSGYKAPPPPEEPAVFDQKGCRFIPHILFVRTKQKVLIKSGDNLVHNTHTNPLKNTGFNKAISPEDREGQPLTYDKPEPLPVSVNCDYHKWMKGWHLVLDHPFGAISDENGRFEIKGLPPGKYEFVVWHESPGYLSRKQAVEIKADKVTEEKLSYTAAQFKVAK